MTKARLSTACKVVRAAVKQPAPIASTSTFVHRSARRHLATAVPDDLLPNELKLGGAAARPDPLVVQPNTAESLGLEEGEKVEVAREEIGRPIYLDAQATTPVDPRVLDAMLPYLTNQFGNPHSRTHAYGWEAEKAVEEARAHVAALIGADAKDIIFTSGATESNNMSIKGVARFAAKSGDRKHIITLQTEHKCVLDSCRTLQDEGFEVTYLPVKPDGVVDLEVLKAAIKPNTCLVSIMTVNNEIGTIQPMEAIGKIVKARKGIMFHTDAAQAVGKIPIDVDKMQIDLMSISGHKIYGPKGVGACYVRRRPRVRIVPIIHGGGQERGLRSGTLPASLAVGFGEACRIAKKEMEYDHAHVSRLSERLHQRLASECSEVTRNGDPKGFPGCLNLSFRYVEGESLLMAMKDIAISSGSACTSASLEPSYVLRALGAAEDAAHSSLRFGIGRFTTEKEVDFVAEKAIRVVKHLRDMSPLWEMYCDGIDIGQISWDTEEHGEGQRAHA